MKEFLHKHVVFWKDRTILYHMALSCVMIAMASVLTYSALIYVNNYPTNYVVPDIFLDNIPIVNVSYVFFQGALVFALIVLVIIITEPKFIPFTLESTALFFIIRSFFMILTHLSAPSIEYYKYIEHEHHIRQVLFTVSSGNDLFFSGHTGVPFLLALMFWDHKILRYVFLCFSVLFAIVVLLGHLHYSIDVLSAYFITYAIFHICRELFKKDWALFLKKEF